MKAIFAHKQTFSRKGNSKNRSVADICAEAARLEGATPHVAEPKRPSLLYNNVETSEIPAMIEARVKEQNALLRRQRKEHPERAGDLRSIRRDTHVLVGYVFSYPVPADDLNNGEQFAEYDRWEEDALNFAITDAERNGLEILSAVAHSDEAHPHFHVLAIPQISEKNPRLNAKLCHEGFVAQTDHLAKKLNGSPSRSYKQAMRNWQDKYHAEVGQRHGQSRMGPGRRRLSRAAYKAEQDLLSTMKQCAAAENELNDTRFSLSIEQDRAQATADQVKTDLKRLRDQIEAERIEVGEAMERDRQQLLNALRDQRHSLVLEERRAETTRLTLQDKIEALDREKGALESQLASVKLKAAKEAAALAVEVIAAVLKGDVWVGKNGKITIRDEKLREDSKRILSADAVRDAIKAMEQIWTALKSRLTAPDLNVQRDKVEKSAQAMRDIGHPRRSR